MTIFQHSWRQILYGDKFQTRRLFQHEDFDGEWGPSGKLVNAGMCNSAMIDEGELKRITHVYAANSDDGRLYDDNLKAKRVKWEVGKTYPVQPGRGQKTIYWREFSPGHIRSSADDMWSFSFHDWTRERFLEHGYIEMRIRILEIWREDVRDITRENAVAEGYGPPAHRPEWPKGAMGIAPKYDFLQVWTDMHDPQMGKWASITEYDAMQANHCPLFLLSRPAHRYDAWALRFELVRP